jgi:hypothetical protein
MSALSRVGISGSDGPAGSEVESVDDPHDESSWAPMTRCDPPQDGSGVLIDHHTGLKLVTQPRKEPPRALRHPRLVAATTHNYEHPSHHCSQERANPSKRNTYSRCPHDVTMPDFCADKATSWSSSSEVKHPSGRSQPSAAARLALGPRRAAQRKLLLKANRRPPSLVDVSRAVTATSGRRAVTAGTVRITVDLVLV